MNPFVSFMASPAGRIVRVVAGIALITWGLIDGPGWYSGYHRCHCWRCAPGGWPVRLLHFCPPVWRSFKWAKDPRWQVVPITQSSQLAETILRL